MTSYYKTGNPSLSKYNYQVKITLNKAARRYNYEWIFRNLSYTFESEKSYAVLGPNGSGKSTLLQIIAGSLSLSEGIIEYAGVSKESPSEKEIPKDEIFHHLSLCTPYLDLPEEFTLKEILKFQSGFKPFINGFNEEAVIDLVDMKREANKQVRFYSSGMKQRVKLILAILADTPVLLLDEPTTNLDESGVKWYLDLVQKFSENRLIIICSNQEREYGFCTERLSISDYKR